MNNVHTIRSILSNYVLISAVLSWVIAQLIKTLITLVVTKKFSVERLFGAGGMPSAHSAMVCALTIAVSRRVGIASPEFAIAFILAGVVMYDAMGVRRAAGEQAKVLNRMMDTWDKDEADELEQESDKELKEVLGHTPLEVLGGALLGILIALLLPH